jgi:ATP-dependent 26S proteasome regulatory subunit
MNDFDKQRRAANVDRAIQRAGRLKKLVEVLDTVQRFDFAHARTERTDDLLILLIAQYNAAKLIEDILGCDLSSFLEDLEYEALRECRYSIKQDAFVDEDCEPVED